MSDSISREERDRYARAFYHAVVDKDLQFGTADDFADWFSRLGWVLHDDDPAIALFYWQRTAEHGRPKPEDES